MPPKKSDSGSEDSGSNPLEAAENKNAGNSSIIGLFRA